MHEMYIYFYSFFDDDTANARNKPCGLLTVDSVRPPQRTLIWILRAVEAETRASR